MYALNWRNTISPWLHTPELAHEGSQGHAPDVHDPSGTKGEQVRKWSMKIRRNMKIRWDQVLLRKNGGDTQDEVSRRQVWLGWMV